MQRAGEAKGKDHILFLAVGREAVIWSRANGKPDSHKFFQ